ncbi:MAG: hypothetical protein JXB47_19000 [Anaerolineae bacterium]|nr:hypothetical protein [Anaerolineae bacterium]
MARLRFELLFAPITNMRAHWREWRSPIFYAEIKRPIPHPSFDLAGFQPRSRLGRLARGAAMALAIVVVAPIAGIIQALGCAVVFFLGIFPFVPWVWRVPTVIVAAAPLAREIQNRRWDVLRSTPYSTREIVEALHAAGTYRAQDMWVYVTRVRLGLAVLVMIALGLGLIFSLELGRPLYLLDWVGVLVGLVYLVAEPLFDVAIDGALGILAATFTRLQVTAMAFALVLRVVLWGVQVLSLLVLIPASASVLEPSQIEALPALVVLGPAYAPLFEFSPAATALMVAAVLALRLACLHLLMWLAVWRAGTITA